MALQPAPEALEELTSRLLDDDEDARYGAGMELQRLGPPVLPMALALTSHEIPRMREMACFILGQLDAPDPVSGKPIRCREGVPALLHLLGRDPVPSVRGAAAAALGHQADPSAIVPLCRLTAEPCSDLRWDAACALGSFYDSTWTSETLPLKPAVTAALLRLMDDEDEEVRDWATFGIHQGGHDTPEVRLRLWKALDDPDPDVRGEAAAGLAQFGDRSLIPRLERLLREDPACSVCYFEAAEALADPSLLPAVLEAAEGWRQSLKPGEELPSYVTSAVERLAGEGR